MRYLVTGATGFIGGTLAELLRKDGHDVVALVRDPAAAKGLEEMGAEVVPGDITDRASLRAPMGDCDGVFHLAAWYKIGQKDSSPALRVNVEGTRNVLEAMMEAEVPKGVYTSSLAVFGDTHGKVVDEGYRHDGPWLSEYDRTKWLAHYEVAEPLMAKGLPLVIVQPGVTYGPGDTSEVRPALVQYLQRKLPGIPARSAYCWSHVEDTARGHLLAMEKGEPGESYILAGPRHTFVEAFRIAERITGIPAPRVLSPTLVGLVAWLTRDERLRVMAGATYLGTSEKARKAFGFTARPLEEGLRETLEHEMRLLGMEPPVAT